jgi:diguanylate cyclase (GGDEF)-like protein
MLSFIDMDGLKFINDNYGHDEGDFAIKELANVIKECCEDGDICARFGGDEFVIFNRNANEDSCHILEQRFNAKLEHHNSIVTKPYKISASIGSVIEKVDSTYTLFKIVKMADEVMYEVKKNKKNSRAGALK